MTKTADEHDDQLGAVVVELVIPVHSELAAMIGTATDRLTFLVNDWGRPFTVGSFSNWFRAQCDTANLHHCSAHGLRKAAARRLAEAGCTEHEIAAITGHVSLREIVRYTRGADQKRLATAEMAKVKTGTAGGQPKPGLAKKGRI
jgi:integrase